MQLFLRVIKILFILFTVSYSEHLDLGKIDHKDVAKEYENFEDSFKRAFIGIPKGFLGLKQDYYATYDEALKEIPKLQKASEKLPTVVYMQGSGVFKKGKTIREWMVEEGKYIFFAPNTHTGKKRPTYSSPVPKSHYEKVHRYRQAEIALFVSKVDQLPFVNREKMFLMGLSEGALAAARYSGNEFTGRIVLAWGCEAGYYTDYPKVGAGKDKPFLNIIGTEDKYFGKDNPWNSAYRNHGHCADALSEFTQSKVVMLPNTGHNLINNPFTKNEILSFLRTFLD